jgi:hypothetical protein
VQKLKSDKPQVRALDDLSAAHYHRSPKDNSAGAISFQPSTRSNENSDYDLHKIVNAAVGADVLVLDGLTMPSELLSLVAQYLNRH